MSVSKHLVTGVLSSVGSAVVGLAVLPYYVQALGEEEYGLVGFAATIQGLFVLVDLGLSQTLNREVARALATGLPSRAQIALATVSRLYWFLGAVLGLIVFLAAPWIVERWINRNVLDVASTERSVRWIGALVFARWPISIYQSALQGALRFPAVNLTTLVAAVAQGLGGVALVAQLPSASALLGLQAVVALTQALFLRWMAWGALGRGVTQVDWRVLRELWGFSRGLVLVTATAIVLSQLDKLLLSALLTLDEFGRYLVAITIARSLYLVTSPVFGVLFPKFSAMAATGSESSISALYRDSSRGLSVFLFSAALVVSLVSKDLLEVWTGNPVLADSAARTLEISAWTAAIHGVMFVPYALQLAMGHTEIPSRINVILCLLTAPATYVLTTQFGMVGAAVAVLIVNVNYLWIGAFLTHRILLRGLAGPWIVNDVGIPFLVAALAAASVRMLPFLAIHSRLGRLTLAMFVGLLVATLLLWISPSVRSRVLTIARTGEAT